MPMRVKNNFFIAVQGLKFKFSAAGDEFTGAVVSEVTARQKGSGLEVVVVFATGGCVRKSSHLLVLKINLPGS
jgi:hypothetical protein